MRLFLVVAVFAVGCGAPVAPAGITYWKDVAPVVSEKCVTCHQEGGIAPMRLDTFEAVKANAALIADVTKSGRMPPFLLTHDGTCGSVEDADTLSAAQVDLLQTWAGSTFAEGTKAVIVPPPKRSLGEGLAFQTPTITPAAQGGVLAAEDEYRCFPYDGPVPTDAFITGYEVLPGNAAMVHHLLAFVVDPARMGAGGKTNGAIMQELDAADPDRQGWPCFGLAGDGVQVESIPVSWGPGQGPVVYPTGIGAPIRKTDRLVIQMHYNLADPRVKGQTDSTTVRLRTAASVERKASFVFFDPLLGSLQSGMPIMLPPMSASTQVKFKVTGKDLGLGQLPYVDLVGTLPHMHGKGRKTQLDIGGSCASKVDAWDIGWQKFYFYKTPIRMTGDTAIELMCDYDTSKQTEPVMPGWGSRNEMCLSVLMVALPKGI